MPDMTQAVPGLLAKEHPAHTHSQDIVARILDLEDRVSALENAPATQGETGPRGPKGAKGEPGEDA